MSLFKIVAQLIVLYILYRLVVNFVIPTYRNISRFRKQFRQMQQEMQRQFNEQQGGSNGQFRNTSTNGNNQPADDKSVSSKEGEYIEFEEVKSQR